MTLALCKTALLDLIKDQENRVIALSGKWGTGKTHLWQRVREETDDAQAKVAVSASLCGVSTIMELKLKIAQGIAPSLGKTNTEGLMTWLGGITKALKGVHSSFSALEEVALLAMPYFVKDRFIIIDDIERKHTKLSIDEILGFIDECVQNHGCRILLILNSDKLKDQEIWGQIREKVVDQEIKLETSPSEAFDIANKLTPSPWPEKMQAAVEALQITNIRIIRKMIRTASQLLGQDPALSPLVLSRVLPSISLLSAIHYEAVEDAPSRKFILSYEASRVATLAALRKSQSEPLSDEQKDHDRWHLTMKRLGINSTDELEAMILAFLDSGVMDSMKIENLVRKYLQKSERLEARKKAVIFEDHLAWHPQLSEDDLVAELDALLPNAGMLSTSTLSKLIPSIDELTGSQQLGLAFVDAWRAAFQTEHPNGVTESWLQFNTQSIDELHPLIRDEIEIARAKYRKNFTVLGICQELLKGKDWGTGEMEFIKSITAEVFESEIRAATGPNLQLLIYKGFEFANSPTEPQGGYGNAPTAFLQACQNIVQQEPGSRLAKIVSREIEIAAMNAQFREEIEEEHAIDLALISGRK
nr:P-loop NTPase fold protein [uncultured Pseudomonas sp.]